MLVPPPLLLRSLTKLVMYDLTGQKDTGPRHARKGQCVRYTDYGMNNLLAYGNKEDVVMAMLGGMYGFTFFAVKGFRLETPLVWTCFNRVIQMLVTMLL